MNKCPACYREMHGCTRYSSPKGDCCSRKCAKTIPYSEICSLCAQPIANGQNWIALKTWPGTAVHKKCPDIDDIVDVDDGVSAPERIWAYENELGSRGYVTEPIVAIPELIIGAYVREDVIMRELCALETRPYPYGTLWVKLDDVIKLINKS